MAWKAVRETMPTSRQTIWTDRQGFSLIELMVVIGLVGLITTLALPSVSSIFRISLGSATRELSSAAKESYNAAVATGNVYRLAYDIEKGEFWAESGPPTLVLDNPDQDFRNEIKGYFARKAEEEQKKKSPFAIDKKINRSKSSLPRGVNFKSILTESSEDPQTTGTVYTHLFPHGVSERTLILLQDANEQVYSLVITPLLGRTILYNREVPKEEAFGYAYRK